MAKNKLINSGFWSDPFVEELGLQEKALFLYFITNELVSLSGIYSITKKRICFDTDMSKTKIDDIIKKFTSENKIYWLNNYIIVVNFLKYQKPNPKMLIAIKKEVSKLPYNILLFLKDNLKKFHSLSIGYPQIKIALDTHLKNKNKNKYINKEENKNKNKNKKSPKKIHPFEEYLQNKIIEHNFIETKDKIFEFYTWRMTEKIKGKKQPYETKKGIDGLFRNMCGCRKAGLIVSECLDIAMERPWLTPDPDYFKGNHQNKKQDGGLDWLAKRKAARERGDIE